MASSLKEDAKVERPDCWTLPSDHPRFRGFEGPIVGLEQASLVVLNFIVAALFCDVAAAGRGLLKGIAALLLVGPPGCAKTSLVWKCLNGSAQTFKSCIKVVALSCSQVFDGELGRSAKNLDARFDRCESLLGVGYRVALVLDDIEAVGLARTHTATSANPADLAHTLTVLLKRLDELANCPRFAVFGTSNHPGLLDPALLDRFGPVIHIPLPDIEARRRILATHLGGENAQVLKDDSAELDRVLRRVEGWSGRALMQRLLQTAMLLTGKPAIELSCTDLNAALDLLSENTK